MTDAPTRSAADHAQGAPPLVSIVTPTYNQAAYLAEAIESVLAQDYPHIEYIVLDDGSTDHTRDVLERYTGRLYWETQKNTGQACTLNKGWATSRGTIVGHLSADDVLFPGAISAAVEALEAHPDVVMVYPDCDLIDPYSRLIRRSVARAFSYGDLVIGQECYVGPGALFRRSVLTAVGGWDPRVRLAPDREFYMRIGLHGRFAMIPRVLAAYRMHPGAISYSEAGRDVAGEYVQVMERYFERHDIPPAIRARQATALSRAHVVEARIHLRAGRLRDSLHSLREARRLDPTLDLGAVGIMLSRTLTSRAIHRAGWVLRHFISKTGGRPAEAQGYGHRRHFQHLRG